MYHFFNLWDYLNLFITKLCFLFLISNFITLYLILLSQTLTLSLFLVMDYRIGFFSLICFFSFIFKKINVWFFFSQNKIFMISDIIQAFSRSFVFFSWDDMKLYFFQMSDLIIPEIIQMYLSLLLSFSQTSSRSVMMSYVSHYRQKLVVNV